MKRLQRQSHLFMAAVLIIFIVIPPILAWLTGSWKLFILMNFGSGAAGYFFLYNWWILRDHLRDRGYDFLTFRQSISLYRRFHFSIAEIPPRDELAILPGYTDSADGISLVFGRWKREERRASRLPFIKRRRARWLKKWEKQQKQAT